ncbi:MAG TPA: methyltransferase domain-containing protein [Jatrophihabitans sp.]|uniref:methyltransferase domain-containing protein n=1 Tax=Jatrophihabitans sp. TaxID=1932789 RepID=UPI002E072A42|nr:methyltransferase domain-containing protein [Jatrophihabitans sp.]
MQTELGRERSGTGRLALMARLLTGALASVSTPGRAPTVLDCGGGSGAYAVPLAASGADVTVVDISADALATLRRRADETGVSASVHAVNGDVERLADHISDQFDLVLAHGILDAVDAVEETFAAMAGAVRPGGLISVLVANPFASVMARALAGEPALALQELRDLDAGVGPGIGPDTVDRLCRAAGLTVESRHGIGVFSDLVPGASLDAPGAREALARLDTEAADRPPFADLAGRIHLLVRRPAS